MSYISFKNESVGENKGTILSKIVPLLMYRVGSLSAKCIRHFFKRFL